MEPYSVHIMHDACVIQIGSFKVAMEAYSVHIVHDACVIQIAQDRYETDL